MGKDVVATVDVGPGRASAKIAGPDARRLAAAGQGIVEGFVGYLADRWGEHHGVKAWRKRPAPLAPSASSRPMLASSSSGPDCPTVADATWCQPHRLRDDSPTGGRPPLARTGRIAPPVRP